MSKDDKQGQALAEAGSFANAAAALTTTRLGARAALPRRHEVLALPGNP